MNQQRHVQTVHTPVIYTSFTRLGWLDTLVEPAPSCKRGISDSGKS